MENVTLSQRGTLRRTKRVSLGERDEVSNPVLRRYKKTQATNLTYEKLNNFQSPKSIIIKKRLKESNLI